MKEDDLLKDPVELESHGIHLFMDSVTSESCAKIIEWILKENLRPKRFPHLKLMICSEGGDLQSCFAVVDVMRGSAIPIHTVGFGTLASAGLIMFISGEKGHRILTPNTAILSHQYSWGSHGKEHELFATVKEFKLTTKRVVAHYQSCTGLTEKLIREYLLPSQDIWLSTAEALKYKLCDKVVNLKLRGVKLPK